MLEIVKSVNKYLVALLLVACSYSTTWAQPVINDWTKATLVFTMLDTKSKLSYVLDLEINLIELLEKRQPFDIDVVHMLGKHTDLASKDVSRFRWGVVGAVDDAILLKDNQFKLFNGYVAAYDAGDLPHAYNLNHVRQKTKRLEYYLKDGIYSSHPYEVSVRNPGMKSGYYSSGWQGNFNGLATADLEAKGVQTMVLWSLMATDLERLRRDKLGTISLSEGGVLHFTPFEKK